MSNIPKERRMEFTEVKNLVEEFAVQEEYPEVTMSTIEKSRPKLDQVYQKVLQSEFSSHFNSVIKLKFNPVSK